MIDWTRVTELRDEIGEEDFAEVVDLFLDEVDGVIAKLEPGAADTEEQLHFLKGSALNLGFDAFAALCQAGESVAAGGNPGAVDIAHLRNVYAASRTEFTAGLDTRLAS